MRNVAQRRRAPFEPLRHAVTPDQIVRALVGIGLTEGDITRATGGSSGDYHARLHELSDICLVLSESLTARGVRQWLDARNRLLENRRPAELIAAGEGERVRQAAASFVDGAVV